MSTDLYGIRGLHNWPEQKKVRLRVFVVYYDTQYKHHEPLPEDHSFFLRVLWDKADTRFGGGGPLGDKIDVDYILDESWVDAYTWHYIDRVECIQLRNYPLEEYAGMQDFYYERDGKWPDEEKLVQADYDVYVTDAAYIQHLHEGMAWGSTAYPTRALLLDSRYLPYLPHPDTKPLLLNPFTGSEEEATPHSFVFNADGSRAYVLSQANELVCYETADWSELFRSPSRGMLSNLNISEQMGIVWVQYDDEILHVWDMETGAESAQMPPSAVRYVSPSGTYFCNYGWEEALVFTDAAGNELRRLPQPGCPEALAFSYTEEYFAVGGNYNSVYVYQAEDAELVRIISLPDGERVSALAFHPAGGLLAVCTLGGPLYVYELENGAEVFRRVWPDGSYTGPAAWLPSGTAFVVQHIHAERGYEGYLEVWELPLGTMEFEPLQHEQITYVDLDRFEPLEGNDELNDLLNLVLENAADYETWYALSEAYAKAGRADMSLECYKVLCLMFPEHHVIWYNKGVTQRDAGLLSDAEETFMQVTEMNPSFGPAWSELGKMSFLRNDVEEGMERYGKALETAPSYTISYINLSYYLIKFGKPGDALYFAGRGIDEGDTYCCPFNKAHAHLMLGEREEAIALYALSVKGARSEQAFIRDFYADFELFAGTELSREEYEALLPAILEKAA